MATYLKWFKEIHKDDIPIAGGKGASLGEMYNAGFPVPPGFVVTADAYRDFLKEKEFDKKIIGKLTDLDIEDSDKLQEVAKEIQKLILSTSVSNELRDKITEFYKYIGVTEDLRSVKLAQGILGSVRENSFVAVRSSATAEDLPKASFAGQQKTFLNIKGAREVVAAVQKCWASLFTARAIYYREKNNFPHAKVAIAVVVQRMINSDKSGVIFTINPSTNNKDQVVIEAVFGLGEAIVSGAVNPNTYVIDKASGNILEKDIPGQTFMFTRNEYTGETVKKNVLPEKQKQQVLDDKEIDALRKSALRIEDHYKAPQDIEWAIERKKIYIVQSRPVTTIKKEEHVEKLTGEPILKGLAASPGVGFGPVKILSSVQELDKIQKGDVLVTEMTNPDFVPAMQRAAGIVTDRGGITCHAAIVSREMGVPCVVGTKQSTKILKDEEAVTVDGSHGLVYKGEVKLETKEETPKEIIQRDTKIKVKVIMDLPDFAEKAAQTKADGVGLLRIEGIIASGKTHPAKYLKDGRLEEYTSLLYKGIYKIASAFKGKPVWVRTSDVRTDEYRGLAGGEEEPEEKNPMLGWHGIRRSLDQPELLKAEFQAIKKIHESGLKEVGIMLPFVISIEEVQKAKEIMREVGLEPVKDIAFGVMIETPASVWLINDLCKDGISFASLGTNDLTQTTLGVDRNNEKLAKLYNEKHDAVMKEIAHVINTCKKNNVKTSICGQAGSDPEMAGYLVELGIDSISANIDAVGKIKEIVYTQEKEIYEK